jgi:hypothetical protein
MPLSITPSSKLTSNINPIIIIINITLITDNAKVILLNIKAIGIK